MRGEAENDRRLARRVAAGDREAFQSFFSASFPRLYRFALARLDGDADAAADIAQETLCRGLDRLRDFRGDSALYTWLCGICRHCIADHWRGSGRAGEIPLEEDLPAVRAALESLSRSSDAGAEDVLRRGELRRLVHATLDALPARYGDALELRYLQELPVPEVARRLGLPYKATESLLSRARAAFRDGIERVLDASPSQRPGRLVSTHE
jgi:RNA polymerase sigma-70 factor (ECF subfamily)